VLNSLLGTAWFNRATCRKLKGDFAQAETDFSKAIELKTAVADAYANRGLVRLLLGNEREAEQDFIKCLSFDKTLKESLERLIREARGMEFKR